MPENPVVKFHPFTETIAREMSENGKLRILVIWKAPDSPLEGHRMEGYWFFVNQYFFQLSPGAGNQTGGCVREVPYTAVTEVQRVGHPFPQPDLREMMLRFGTMQSNERDADKREKLRMASELLWIGAGYTLPVNFEQLK